jgi:hypothetical protein
VIGQKFDNIVVLSPDEENCKVLVSDRDGIYLPCGIHCDRASNQLLLTKTGVLKENKINNVKVK